MPAMRKLGGLRDSKLEEERDIVGQVMNMNEYLSQQDDQNGPGQRKLDTQKEPPAPTVWEEDEQPKQQADNHADELGDNSTWLSELHLTLEEPMELTCAQQLTDELDLELSQLEWWRLNGLNRRPTLLWRLKGAGGGQATREAHVIDYVTRANELANSSSTAGEMDADLQELARIQHLLAAGLQAKHHQASSTNRTQTGDQPMASKSGLYLCRVTNKAGHLNVYHLVRPASSPGELRLSQGRRRLRKAGMALAKGAVFSGGIRAERTGWLLPQLHNKPMGLIEFAKQSLHSYTNGQHKQPLAHQVLLFVPVYLPNELLIGDEPVNPPTPTASSAGRSLGQADGQQLQPASQWRPTTTTRQVNRTRIPYGHSMEANNKLTDADSPGAPRNVNIGQQASGNSGNNSDLLLLPLNGDLSLHSIALGLIGRFTSNRPTLISGLSESFGQPADGLDALEDIDADTDADVNDQLKDNLISSTQTESKQSLPATMASNLRWTPIVDKLRSSWRLAKGNYLHRWPLMDSPYLWITFGLVSCLLVGCILTTLLIVRLRRGANSRRRVADCSDKAHCGQTGDDGRESRQSEAGRLGSVAPESPPCDAESTLGQLAAGDLCGPGALFELDKAATSGGSSGGSTSNGSQRKLIRCAANLDHLPASQEQQLASVQQVHAGYELLLPDSCQSDLDADISGALEDSLAGYAACGRQNEAPAVGITLDGLYERHTGKPTCQDLVQDLQTNCSLNGSRPGQLIVLQTDYGQHQEMQGLYLSPYYIQQSPLQQQTNNSLRLLAAQSQLLEACQQTGLGDTFNMAPELGAASCEESTSDRSAEWQLASGQANRVGQLDKNGRICTISGLCAGEHQNSSRRQVTRAGMYKLQQYNDHLCSSSSVASPAASSSSSQLTANNAIQLQRLLLDEQGVTNTADAQTRWPSLPRPLDNSAKEQCGVQHEGQQTSQNVVYLDDALQLLHSSIENCGRIVLEQTKDIKQSSLADR